MSLKTVLVKHSNWPIWKGRIETSDVLRNIAVKQVLDLFATKAIRQATGGQNYPISSPFFNNLYERFVFIAKKNFDFSLSLQNLNTCWAYVSNKESNETGWHNHKLTSTLNGVYYLQMNSSASGIRFRQNGQELLLKPQVNDLLIFPNELEHYPVPSTDDNRISINMEILANEKVESIFNSTK